MGCIDFQRNHVSISDCIGLSSECCQKSRYELYADDELTLTSKYTRSMYDWCDQVIIVRRNNERYDECNGCTLTVEFSSTTNLEGDFGSTLELDLLEANYSSVSYYTSETLYLDYLVSKMY